MNTAVVRHPATTVAIIGAGPAGLACARWLLRSGFEPLLIEASAGLGGQWNQGEGQSAVWPGMRTNTSSLLTSFSDLAYPEGTPLFPRHDQVLAYLRRYAAHFGIDGRVRARTRVQKLDREGDGWRLDLLDANGTSTQEVFSRVVVATGRQARPQLPDLAGSAQFTGEQGIRHASMYRGPEPYRGRDVIVGGCSISALEIASDLALTGANRVVLATRRLRYVLPKLLAGVPTDVAMFTRGAALAAERLPFADMRAGLKQMLLQAGAQPAAYGAPKADEDPFVAGVSQAQHFLPLVAEGRIEVRPWIERLAGRDVFFTDGSRCAADGLLLGTGYRLDLPFLAPRVATTLDLDGEHIDLHEHTFHPDLPGLAFMGLYDQTGPLLPVLELQARWIAYAMAGLVAAPADGDDAAGHRAVPRRPGRTAGRDDARDGAAIRAAGRRRAGPRALAAARAGVDGRALVGHLVQAAGTRCGDGRIRTRAGRCAAFRGRGGAERRRDPPDRGVRGYPQPRGSSLRLTSSIWFSALAAFSSSSSRPSPSSGASGDGAPCSAALRRWSFFGSWAMGRSSRAMRQCPARLAWGASAGADASRRAVAAMTARRSAGLLLYRRREGRLQVLLVHPGGPFWAKRDEGAWSVPKGEIGPEEDPLAAARREFIEELGSEPQASGDPVALEPVRQKSGKLVMAWAQEGTSIPRSCAAIPSSWNGRRAQVASRNIRKWTGPGGSPSTRPASR